MRRLLSLAALLALPLAGTALWACTSDSTSTDSTDGGGAGTDGGSSTQDSGPKTEDAGKTQDAGSTTGVRCTQAEFDQAASPTVGGDYTSLTHVDILFPTEASPGPYTPRCVKVKSMAMVNFKGNFQFHPLEPKGGDAPTPIPSQSTNPDGGTLSIMVMDTGTFGFQCQFHPTTMYGAIQVVP